MSWLTTLLCRYGMLVNGYDKSSAFTDLEVFELSLSLITVCARASGQGRVVEDRINGWYVGICLTSLLQGSNGLHRTPRALGLWENLLWWLRARAWGQASTTLLSNHGTFVLFVVDSKLHFDILHSICQVLAWVLHGWCRWDFSEVQHHSYAR